MNSVLKLIRLGLHNARIFAKKIPQHKDQNVFDSGGSDILYPHQDIRK